MKVLIAASISLAILLPFNIVHWFNMARSLAATRWPQVKGTFRGCEVVSRTPWLWNNRMRFRVVVDYDYVVSGRFYTGTRLMLYRRWNSNAGFEQASLSRKIGKPVDVYYDPRDPASSVLRTGIEWDAIMRPVCAFLALFLLVGAIMASG